MFLLQTVTYKKTSLALNAEMFFIKSFDVLTKKNFQSFNPFLQATVG